MGPRDEYTLLLLQPPNPQTHFSTWYCIWCRLKALPRGGATPARGHHLLRGHSSSAPRCMRAHRHRLRVCTSTHACMLAIYRTYVHEDAYRICVPR